MLNPFENMVALRYLRARKSEGFVSVIAAFSFTGIMLGVATLIIVMSVMNGFRAELFNRILGLNGHMNVYSGTGAALQDYREIAGDILFMDGVKSVTPIIESQGLINSRGQASGVVVRGMTPEDLQDRKSFSEAVVAGNIEDFKGFRLAIGKVLARKFNLLPGDQVTLTAPKVKAGPFGSIPRQRAFEIAFIFDLGMYEYDSGFAFMPLAAAQTLYQYPDSVTAVEVFLTNANDLDVMRLMIEDKLGERGKIYDWRDTNKSFFNALQVERNVMFLILTLIIIVAAFNIISSMIMLVKDKTHDIAIMRTYGVTRGAIMRIFVMTGAMIGILGTACGAILGIVFAMNIDTIKTALESLTGTELFAAEIYFLSQLPAEINFNEVAQVVVMALVLSVLATLYPAWRAARLEPVEALRYE